MLFGVVAVLLMPAACAGVPASVAWSTTGAVAGAAGAAFTLDDDIVRAFLGE